MPEITDNLHVNKLALLNFLGGVLVAGGYQVDES